MKLNVITPTSDRKLSWNEELQRYELTIEYFKSLFGNNFHDDQILLNRLKKNSRKVYNFIRYRGYSMNWKISEFLINHTQEGRDFILAALTEQMEADAESGFNDLSSIPAVNAANGQVLDREQLYANQVSVDTEQLIENSATYLGVCVVSRTLYPYNLYDLWRANQ